MSPEPGLPFTSCLYQPILSSKVVKEQGISTLIIYTFSQLFPNSSAFSNSPLACPLLISSSFKCKPHLGNSYMGELASKLCHVELVVFFAFMRASFASCASPRWDLRTRTKFIVPTPGWWVGGAGAVLAVPSYQR